MSMSKTDCLQLLQEQLPNEWKSVTEDEVVLEPITGGLINTLYLITRKSDNFKIIIRKYGGGSWDNEHVRKFRIAEGCQAMVANEVSRLGIGPKVFNIFDGGRMEEFIPSHNLTPEEFNQEEILTDVAINAAMVHHINLPLSRKMHPWIDQLVETYSKFYRDINDDRKGFVDKYRDIVTENDADVKIFEEIMFHDFSSDLVKLGTEIGKIKNKRIGMVLWDNNFMNCLIRDEPLIDNQLRSVLIDYEYAQYYYTSFDCASRFVNIMINYTGEGKNKLSGHAMLTEEKRRHYVKQYLIKCYQLEQSSDAVTEQIVDNFMHEVNLFTLFFMTMIIGFIHGTPTCTLDRDASWIHVCVEIFKVYKNLIQDFNYQQMLDNPNINPPVEGIAKSEIRIVAGKPADASQVYDLLQQHYRFHSPTGIPEDWPVTEEMIKNSVGSFSDGDKYFELILAKDGHKVVGEIIYHKLFSFYLGKVISLSQILVDENYRGRQVGKKMMIQLCRVADAEKAVIQWRTREWNVGAQTFYESIGAKIINETIGINSDIKHIGMQLDREAIKTLANCDI